MSKGTCQECGGQEFDNSGICVFCGAQEIPQKRQQTRAQSQGQRQSSERVQPRAQAQSRQANRDNRGYDNNYGGGSDAYGRANYGEYEYNSYSGFDETVTVGEYLLFILIVGFVPIYGIYKLFSTAFGKSPNVKPSLRNFAKLQAWIFIITFCISFLSIIMIVPAIMAFVSEISNLIV